MPIIRAGEGARRDLCEVIVDGSESAKDRPGMAKLLAMVNTGNVNAIIVAKLDRLTRSVKDLCELLELFFAASEVDNVIVYVSTLKK